MAFDIRNLFGPGALNMLLQPTNGKNAQNLLMQMPDVGAPPVVAGPQPDPMTTAALAGPAPQPMAAAPQVAGGGGRETMSLGLDPAKKQFLQDMFLGWAAGATPEQSLALGAAQAVQGKSERGNQNQTVEWLKGKGMDEQGARMLAGNPKALGDYLQQINRPKDPMDALAIEKTQLEINKLRQGRPEAYNTLTAEEKASLGLDPNKAYQRGVDNKISEIGGNGVSVNVEAPKLPSGYRFIDTANPNIGVEPIPGGPATQLPGELAARIGLADNWLKNDLPTIKQSVSNGEVTGPIDRFQAANNQGSPQATTYRKIQSGVEVLSRLLSGAGMTQIEVDEKAARYQPTYTDDAASLSKKMEQLAQEIRATRDSALTGRGGPVPSAAPAADAGAPNVDDLLKKYGGQ